MAALADTEFDELGTSAEEEDDRRRRGILAALGLLAILLLIVWWVFSRYVAVPDVVGLNVPSATRVIESAGFVVGEVLERPSVEGRAGHVTGQSPEGGSRALKGSSVDLFIAEGEPDDPDDARRPGDGEFDFSWAPPAGEPRPVAPAGSTDGRPRVPQAQGLSESDGVALLRRAGYRVTVDYGPSTTAVPRGIIYYQDPPPDTVVARGTTVSVWVSTGSPRPGENEPRP